METATSVQAATITPRGGVGTVLQSQVQLISSPDGMFSDQDRVTITAGRAVNPAHPDEVVASTRAAAVLDLHVGSRVPVGVWSGAQKKHHPLLPEARPDAWSGLACSTPRSCRTTSTPPGPASCSARPRWPGNSASCCTSDVYVGLRLTGGSGDDTAVAREYEELENTSPFYAHGGGQLLQVLQVYNTSDIEAEAQRAIRPEAIALGVFGVIAGLAALLIGVQSISRQLQAGSGDTEILRGLGASPAATTADGLPGILGAIAAGSLLAVAVAVGLSPLTLFGPVRVAEPSAGIYLDAAVLGLGALFLFTVLGAVAVVIGFRLAPHRVAARGQRGRRGSGAVRAALAAGLPVPVVAGTRFALEPGHGRTVGAGALGHHRGGAGHRRGHGHAHLRRQPQYAGVAPGPLRLELQLRPVLDRRLGAIPPGGHPPAGP